MYPLNTPMCAIPSDGPEKQAPGKADQGNNGNDTHRDC